MSIPAQPPPADSDGRREQSASARLRAADLRDVIAHDRDLAATERDRTSDTREPGSGDRRVRAVLHDAAQDREQAARERLYALVDRELLANQLAVAETDPLTKARTRAAGLADLDRELDRCRRNDGSLVVVYVDVVGLKTLNDRDGHSAGDALLTHVVGRIRAHLRSYDLIVRLGGDEFLCVMSEMTRREARVRFDAIGAGLAAADKPSAISSGFAVLRPGDDAEQLIARADGELIESRRANPDSRQFEAYG
jgi:diguanylate cyclase (GGDEF)-like protein